MRMPFNLDPKSIVVGGLLTYFVLPYLLNFLTSRKS